MTLIVLFVLGIVQGLAEFLPISSSGHLALLEHLFHLSQSQRLSYTAFFHLGTFLALLFYFRKKIYYLITDTFNYTSREKQKVSLKTILLIIVGTIPIGIVGHLLKNQIDTSFQNPLYSAIFLLITGVVLFLTKFSKEIKTDINYSDAVLIGLAQAIAVFPGISRSGATISIALFLGLPSEKSFEFSFLLSIPAVLGANILLLKDISFNLSTLTIVFSLIIPFIVGIISLSLLQKIVIAKRLYYFSYYCWLVGIIALLLLTI